MIEAALLERGERFRDDVRTWLGQAMTRVDPADRDGVETRRHWDRLVHAAGFAGLTWPEEFGGRGLSLLEEFIFHEESARVGAPEGYGRVGRILVGPLLIAHGSAGQQARYLPRILDGSEVWCQGFSEPSAGSDLANIQTRAVLDGDRYVLDGQKIWTSFADGADYCLVLAKSSPDAPRYRNLGMFLVDMDQPGVDVRPIRRNSGDSTFSEVFLDGASAAVSDVVGAPDAGWKMAMAVLTDERGPVEALTRYMAMGGPLGLLQACCGAGREDLDTMAARVELVRWHAMRSLAGRLGGERDARADAVSKLMWSHAWQDLARYGLDRGCRDHADFWMREYLESRAAGVFSGTTQVQLNIVAERVLGLPR